MIGSYLFSAFNELQIDGQTILQYADINTDVFRNPEPAISANAYIKFWAVVEANTNRPDASVIVGRAAGASATNKMHLIVYGSETTEVYLQKLAHYAPLIGAAISTMNYADGRIELPHLREELDAAGQFHICAQIVAMVENIRNATGHPFTPARVMIEACNRPQNRTPQHIYEQALSDYLGIAAETGTASFIEFDGAALQMPFRLCSWFLWSSISENLNAQLWRALDMMPTHKLVERALEELMPKGKSSIEAVAIHLAIGRRTLQRRLQNEGTEFRAVHNKTRQRLAKNYMRDGRMTQGAIARLLGFQDTNSLYRLVRQWRN